METWKTLDRDMILDLTPYLKVEAHKIQLPNGEIIEDWPWLITPNFVNVVAITKENEYLCFRQTKYSVNGTSLAPVGARVWENLGQFAVDGNRGNGVAYFFMAREAYLAAEINADDLEEQVLLKLSRVEVEAAVARGAFKVLPWQAIMALALLRL